MSDILEYSQFKEDFAKSIGRYSMEILKEIKDLHHHDFGIYIELHPDEEERAVLEQHINTSLSQGKIDIDDAIDIRNVRNVKIASQLLKVRKQSRERDARKQQQENIQQQAEANQSASMAAEQAKQQREMAKKQAEMELMKMESDLKLLEMEKEFALKLRLIQAQKSLEGNIQGMQVQGQLAKEKYREDRKDKRTAKQATQQSKLIQQRQQDLDPIDFDGQDLLSTDY
jgi:hypothetical protein